MLVLVAASVPVTVSVYVPAIAPAGAVLVVDLLLDPPQPERTPKTETAANSTSQRAGDLRRSPISNNPTPLIAAIEISALPARAEPDAGREDGCEADAIIFLRAELEVVTVSQSLPV